LSVDDLVIWRFFLSPFFPAGCSIFFFFCSYLLWFPVNFYWILLFIFWLVDRTGQHLCRSSTLHRRVCCDTIKSDEPALV
jgi:hypothetical protein